MDEMIGKRFGKLVVLSKAKTPKGDKSKKSFWLCRCDCGNEKIINRGHLVSGDIKSCGCAQKENHYFADITGNRYGKLIALNRVKKPEGVKVNCSYWLCKCDCGNEKIVNWNSLRTERTRSCGCINKSYSSHNMNGRRFGKLVVIRKAKKPDGSKLFGSYCLCKCDCGNEKVIKLDCLIREYTKSCGCEAHKNMPFKDITGNRYGMLEVIKRIDKPSNKKETSTWWLCQCDCGRMKEAYSSTLNDGKVVSCGCLSESIIALRIKDYFKKEYGALTEYRIFKNNETGRYLPFDIYVPSSKLFIEIQGQQHFKFVKRWHKDDFGFENQMSRDNKKREYAERNGAYLAIDIRSIDNISDVIDCIKGAIFNNE